MRPGSEASARVVRRAAPAPVRLQSAPGRAAGLVTQPVKPVINLMRDALLKADLIYGDETTFQVLKEPGRRPQTKSHVWAQMNGAGPPVR